MPDTAHDDWIKATLGLNVTNSSIAAKPLPPAPPDKQSQEFRAQFDAALRPVDTAIAYLSDHADNAKTEAVAKKREVLLTVYTTALGKIDPADEAKGKPAVTKALDGVKAAAAAAAAAQKTAEKVFADWSAREPKLEEAAGKIEEMEDWGYQKVVPLRTQLDAVKAPAEARSFDLASTAADRVLAAAKPLIDGYEKQKAAQEKYVPAHDALADRLAKATANDRAKLQGKCGPVGAARDMMEASANEKNFVHALEQLGALTPKLEAFEAALAELDHKKEVFEAAKAELQPKLPQLEQSTFKKLEPKQKDIATGQSALDTAEHGEDYDQATKIVGSLSGKCAEYGAELTKLQEGRGAYDKAWAVLQPRIPTTSTAGGKRIVALEQSVATQSGKMTAAAEAEEYGTALPLAKELDAHLTDLEKAVEARKRYDEQKKALEPKMPQTKTGAPTLTGLESQIDSLHKQAEAFAAEDDYDKACAQLLLLEKALADYEAAANKLAEQKKAYEEGLAAVDKHLPTPSEPSAGRLAELQKKIEALRASAEAAAKKLDYDAALKTLNELEALLPEYDDLVSKRKQYTERWAELQKRMPTATGADTSPDIVKLFKSITDLRAGLESKAAKGDYSGALTDLDTMVKLLSDLEAAKAAAIHKREEFEKAYADIKQVVEHALATATDIPAVKAKQDALSASKAKVDDAVKKNDYDTAQPLLKDVDTALKAYAEELRKTPRNCAWINATATDLLAGIMQHYMSAQKKIDVAAGNYDKALDAHKKAVASVDAKKQLVDDLLVGIFFAGLGGAAGGAVGSGLKSAMQKGFTDTVAGGAILDATKDVAKFTTRSLEKLGGTPGNPTAVSSNLGGSGVELARNIGASVNAQGEALTSEVRKLTKLVRDSPEACDSKEGIRVEGDPAASIDSDPFLKLLGTIASSDQRSFAKLLWGTWIDKHAYSISEYTNRTGTHEVVDDNVEGFFAWWAHLVAQIEEQTGQDFGLRARLDKAREEVQKKLDENKQKNHGI